MLKWSLSGVCSFVPEKNKISELDAEVGERFCVLLNVHAAYLAQSSYTVSFLT